MQIDFRLRLCFIFIQNFHKFSWNFEDVEINIFFDFFPWFYGSPTLDALTRRALGIDTTLVLFVPANTAIWPDVQNSEMKGLVKLKIIFLWRGSR